jgi:chromosome partitioning protein
MKTFAIACQKGGAGKTTTAVNLAAALGERGMKTLVIDTDPQGCASRWLGVEDTGAGLLAALTNGGRLADLIRPSTAPGVDLIPAGGDLAAADYALSGHGEKALADAMKTLPKGRYRFALIDAPPSLGPLTVNTIVAADGVLAPVECHIMALNGMGVLVELIDGISRQITSRARLVGVIPCRVDLRLRHPRQVLERLRANLGDLVYTAVARENVKLAEAPAWHQPVTVYAPDSRGAEDYRAIADELLTREGKA